MSTLGYFFGGSSYVTADQITSLNQRASALTRRLIELNKKSRDEVATLRETVAKLMLVVETQHRLLLQKGLCTGEEFDKLLTAVDAEDGKVDGRITPPEVLPPPPRKVQRRPFRPQL